MNKLIIVGFVWCAGVATCGWSQEINVTSTGVEVGAAGSSALGSLMQQSGQTTSFVTKDGVNPPEVRMMIKPDGKVGIGTTAPRGKFEVLGEGGLIVSAANLDPSKNYNLTPLQNSGCLLLGWNRTIEPTGSHRADGVRPSIVVFG